MDEFDKLLAKTIDKTIRYVMGDQNALIAYYYLEKISCPSRETPKELDVFSKTLRGLLELIEGKFQASLPSWKMQSCKAFPQN